MDFAVFPGRRSCPGVSPQRCRAHVITQSYPVRTVIQLSRISGFSCSSHIEQGQKRKLFLLFEKKFQKTERAVAQKHQKARQLPRFKKCVYVTALVRIRDHLNLASLPVIRGVRDVCGNFISLPHALSGVKPAKYVDTDIQFSCSSRIKRQNHKYHYTEHLFVCQELFEKMSSTNEKPSAYSSKAVDFLTLL